MSIYEKLKSLDITLAAPATPAAAYVMYAQTGNTVFIDGVPVTGANATMPVRTGSLAGLASYPATAGEQVRQLFELPVGAFNATLAALAIFALLWSMRKRPHAMGFIFALAVVKTVMHGGDDGDGGLPS